MSKTIAEILDEMTHDELLQFAHWYAKELKKDTRKSAEPQQVTSTDGRFIRKMINVEEK